MIIDPEQSAGGCFGTELNFRYLYFLNVFLHGLLINSLSYKASTGSVCKKIAFLTMFESLIIIVSKAKNCMVAANGIKLFKHCVCPISAHPNRNKKQSFI